MKYIKRVEITVTGMVIATIFDENGRKVGAEFFTSIFNSIKVIDKKTVKAHKWADEYIKMCIAREANIQATEAIA